MFNYGQQPNIRGEHRKHVRNESAKEFVEMMQGTFKLAQESLEHAASDMKKFYDRKTRPVMDYQKGDLVLLKGTNIRSDHPSKKLGDKRYGPFKVIEKIGNSTYHLKLDPKWHRIHNVLNECLLHPYHKGTFPSQKMIPPPPPDLINGVEEQEIEEILASKEQRGKIEYLIHWKGFPSEENEWITESNLKMPLMRSKNFTDHPARVQSVKGIQSLLTLQISFLLPHSSPSENDIRNTLTKCLTFLVPQELWNSPLGKGVML